CLRRVNRLVENGVIERLVALVAPDRVGYELTALVEVALDSRDKQAIQEFEEVVQREKAVRQCYRVSGGLDFMLLICVPDMPSFQETEERLFRSNPNVKKSRSYFS